MTDALRARAVAEIEASIEAKQKILADDALLQSISNVAAICIEAFKNGNKVLLAGNGGSAADAQHIAAEFVCRYDMERKPLPSMALTTDSSIMTAISNDFGYEEIFSRQLQANGVAGDVFIGISTSGGSPNIVKAIQACKALGIKAVSMTGATGAVVNDSDYSICIPSSYTPRIQESHILVGHILCKLVEDSLFD